MLAMYGNPRLGVHASGKPPPTQPETQQHGCKSRHFLPAQLALGLAAVLQALHVLPIGVAPVRRAIRAPGNQVTAHQHIASVDLPHGCAVARAVLANVDGEDRQANEAACSQVVPVHAAQHRIAVLQQRGLVHLTALVIGQLGAHRGGPVSASRAVGRQATGQVVPVHLQDVSLPALQRGESQRAGQGRQQQGRDGALAQQGGGLVRCARQGEGHWYSPIFAACSWRSRAACSSCRRI